MCEMPYGPQTLWPVHCVQGSKGAEFHPGLRTDLAQMVLRKGSHPEVDSYSGFFENDHETPTGLDGYLRSRGVTAITLVGLSPIFALDIRHLTPQNWVMTLCGSDQSLPRSVLI